MSEKYLNVLASEMDFVLHEALRVRQCVPPRRYKKHQTESVESASDEWNGVTLGIDRDAAGYLQKQVQGNLKNRGLNPVGTTRNIEMLLEYLLRLPCEQTV